MPRNIWPLPQALSSLPWPPMLTLSLLALALWATAARGMTDDAVSQLRSDTQDLFYHGYDNYMAHAFPEDELKPLSCAPQTRNRQNPADIGLNDVLGNYSLTLIDSLSTLAILASGPKSKKDKRRPLRDFQDGIKSLVELYGDGTETKPCGTRACGFDLDSKVQVFETNIRGVGGLLSAHLFAIGELPIRGYAPIRRTGKTPGIKWKNGLLYDRQLLDLAYDLASRLLPAFNTSTDIPYPRVNLRYGIPFYKLSEDGMCRLDGSSTEQREITENCAAGAGSLVLEFSTLSRLTGDMRFEQLAKRAFWAIWNRRSNIGLIGNGIDAESGQWTTPALAGIGAGIDSFFEYSFKSHILLSGLSDDNNTDNQSISEHFLPIWQQTHAAVKHHILRGQNTEKYSYYGQVDLVTGAQRYAWVDNLSAYYPGLLTLAGELEEAIQSHLLFSALWTRYSALPERWNAANAYIDSNFKHWAGRPEFIESTFYLNQATKDPYYLHVGEMTLRDIRRRCWTKCGWTDLSDVSTGEQRDRMESFFLGETAKYLYLLFSEDHPLNKLDRPMVFTTEGHPLVIPNEFRESTNLRENTQPSIANSQPSPASTCPTPPPPLPLTYSHITNRTDLFHPAALAQLHLVPVNPSRSSPLVASSPSGPGISFADVRSPTNYTFYPWTLPQDLIPPLATNAPIRSAITSILTFPHLGAAGAPEADTGFIPLGAVVKIEQGVLINSLSNMKLNMIQQTVQDVSGAMVDGEIEYQIHGIANFPLGRDEVVVLSQEALKAVSPTDPHFTRVKDLERVDLVVDVPVPPSAPVTEGGEGGEGALEMGEISYGHMVMSDVLASLFDDSTLEYLKSAVTSRLAPSFSLTTPAPTVPPVIRETMPAILAVGPGAAPLADELDSDTDNASLLGNLPYKSLFLLDDFLCEHTLPANIPKEFQVLVLPRGGCSFNAKLANIPSFVPGPESLRLVVVLSSPAGTPDHTSQGSGEDHLIRPLLEELQRSPHGVLRRHPIPMMMVQGGEEQSELLRRVATGQGSFDEEGRLVFEAAGQEGTWAGGMGSGVGVKRRFWFESLGVRIGNLVVRR